MTRSRLCSRARKCKFLCNAPPRPTLHQYVCLTTVFCRNYGRSIGCRYFRPQVQLQPVKHRFELRQLLAYQEKIRFFLRLQPGNALSLQLYREFDHGLTVSRVQLFVAGHCLLSDGIGRRCAQN
jgi:hypothetical protein